MMIRRRLALQIPLAATAGTLAATLWPRKPSAAATLPSLAKVLDRLDPPVALPDGVFLTQDGTSHRLTEFKGRGMVVNLWATWCVPCVAEMPSLENLSKALAPDDIAVLPLSSDRGGAEKVASWYQEHGITALPVLMDPKGAMARAFEARGLPTTVIVNTAGLVVARLEGAADWASADAQAIIKKLAAG